MAKFHVTDDLLTAALAGYQAELERIDVKMGEIRRTLGDHAGNSAAPPDTGRSRRSFTKKSRAKMAASQRLRWQRIKGAAAPKAETTKKPKRAPLSASARKRIAEAQRKRWSAVRKAAESQAAVAKKAVRKKTVVKKAVARKPKKSAPPDQAAAVSA